VPGLALIESDSIISRDLLKQDGPLVAETRRLVKFAVKFAFSIPQLLDPLSDAVADFIKNSIRGNES